MNDKGTRDSTQASGNGENGYEIEGDRGLPSINKKKSGNSSALGKVLGLFAILAVAGIMLMLGGGRERAPGPERVEQRPPGLARGLPDLQVPALVEPQPELPAPQRLERVAQTGEPIDDLLERRKRAPLLAVARGDQRSRSETARSDRETDRQRQAVIDRRQALERQLAELEQGVSAFGSAGIDRAAGGAQDRDMGPLEASLVSTNTVTARAGLLENRHFLVPKGTFLDCAMITAISSEQAGFTSCRLTRNVYSDTGRVLLLERGSIVEGEYQSGRTSRGTSRIFVLWTRVRTPNGVVVDLDSPGTDQLGRSGLTGWVDRHFAERFGAAILLSLVEGSSAYLQERARGDGASIFVSPGAESTSRIAELALQDSIGIPPTINVNQGEHINVYVARDLDFSGVYALRRTLED